MNKDNNHIEFVNNLKNKIQNKKDIIFCCIGTDRVIGDCIGPITGSLLKSKINSENIYGDLDEAENYFMQSSKQEDLEAGSYYYLSQIALLKGDEEKAKNYMNVAVQLDPKVYKQAQRDPVFTPIKEEINPPEEKETKPSHLTNEEKKVNRHLMKTCILVKNLSKEDIQIMKNNKQNQIDKEEKQKE